MPVRVDLPDEIFDNASRVVESGGELSDGSITAFSGSFIAASPQAARINAKKAIKITIIRFTDFHLIFLDEFMSKRFQAFHQCSQFEGFGICLINLWIGLGTCFEFGLAPGGSTKVCAAHDRRVPNIYIITALKCTKLRANIESNIHSGGFMMHEKASHEQDKDISALLRQKRQSKKLTQKQVADKAGMDIRQYQHFEYCERSLITASFSTTMAVLGALDIDADYFIETYITLS